MSQLAKFAESSAFLSQAEAGQKRQPTGLWNLARLYPSLPPEFNVYQRTTSSGFTDAFSSGIGRNAE
jgi:hypothetical protein